jgi:hypothetical protein
MGSSPRMTVESSGSIGAKSRIVQSPIRRGLHAELLSPVSCFLRAWNLAVVFLPAMVLCEERQSLWRELCEEEKQSLV